MELSIYPDKEAKDTVHLSLNDQHTQSVKTGNSEAHKYRIFDAHCHIYPESIATKAVEGINLFYENLPFDPYDGTTGTLLCVGRQAGISHYVVHSVATTPHQISSINHFIAKEVTLSRGAFTGLGTLHPDSEHPDQDIVMADVRNADENPAVFLQKLPGHCQRMQGIPQMLQHIGEQDIVIFFPGIIAVPDVFVQVPALGIICILNGLFDAFLVNLDNMHSAVQLFMQIFRHVAAGAPKLQHFTPRLHL